MELTENEIKDIKNAIIKLRSGDIILCVSSTGIKTIAKWGEMVRNDYFHCLCEKAPPGSNWPKGYLLEFHIGDFRGKIDTLRSKKDVELDLYRLEQELIDIKKRSYKIREEIARLKYIGSKED